MSYDELIACRRKHLNTGYIGKRGKGDAFDHANDDGDKVIETHDHIGHFKEP